MPAKVFHIKPAVKKGKTKFLSDAELFAEILTKKWTAWKQPKKISA